MASKRLGRKSGFLEPHPGVLIVCEGRSEATVLDALRAHWRRPSARVRVVAAGGDPSSVLRMAKNERRRGDHVVVVFDRDDHVHWSNALEQCRHQGFTLAVSNPCFELWALLLHEDRFAPIESVGAQRRLRELHRGYDHHKTPYLDLETVLDGIEDAARRSRQLEARARANGDPYANPTTYLPLAIAALKSAGP